METRTQILQRFDELTPQLQAAAKFIIDNPNEVVISSMRTVAGHAGVQPSTLVRLAQQLGYGGWPELKDAFARDMGLHAERYVARALTLANRGQDASLVTEMFSAQRRNLDLTEADAQSALQLTAALLQKAPNVHIAGFRASFPIAYSLLYGYSLFRNTVYLVDGLGAGLEMQQRRIQRDDAVVVISFAPYSREAAAVTEAAMAAKARIVAFTDSHVSPLALQADVVVLFSVDSPSFFPSIAAGIAASEALLELLVASDNSDIASKIDVAEKALYDTGAYLQQPRMRVPDRNAR